VPPIVLAVLVLVGACSGGAKEDVTGDPHEPGAWIRALLDGAEAPVLASSGDTVHLSPELEAFYQRRDFTPAWVDPSGFLPRGRALVSALGSARAEGLDPLQYQLAGIERLVERARREYAQGLPIRDVLGPLDLLLTEAFIRYTSDLVRGTVDPEASGVVWRIPRGDPTDASFLERVVEREDFAAALAELRPSVPFYRHLHRALEHYQRVVDSGGWPPVGPGPTLEVGDRGERVLKIRRRLVAEGNPTEAGLAAGAADPQAYDSALARAVRHFQERHGLEPDGTLGAETVETMDVPAEERLLAVQLNLDRWRWLPRDLGERYVMVNVAGFQLSVMEKAAPVLRMNVVVGKDARRTPLFQDTLEYMVANPYWNVPPNIARKDILPLAARDPDYLARNGFEVVNRRGGSGSGLRQRPGRSNALGEVKFVFPNDMDVYLHDTPARHLFKETRRAFSSGCIRVEKPKELAEYLLRTSTSLPPGSYDSLVAGSRERWVRLERGVPIYILYFTAWAEEDGTVFFYRDIYDRDQVVMAAARDKFGGGTPLARLAQTD
jgi:murein L,D-transpeptidase YcbB/YkuD